MGERNLHERLEPSPIRHHSQQYGAYLELKYYNLNKIFDIHVTLLCYMFYIVKHGTRYFYKRLLVKHEITLSAQKKLQKRN